MHSVFWAALFTCAYSYFIYPLLLLLVWRFRARPVAVAVDGQLPPLSVIITVHNAGALLAAKLENTLTLDYPSDLLEIIVASDGSTDETDEIAANYADRGVILLQTGAWVGKEAAQLAAIQRASHDILVFSDLGTTIPAPALKNLAGYFSDASVGAVSSEDELTSESGEVVGEGLYVRYEMGLRKLESEVAGLVGLSGSFFALRKAVAETYWDTRVCSDFIAAVSCARVGLRAVTATDVRGRYADLADPSLEYRRKLRTTTRGITSLARNVRVLNPLVYGWFAFQVFSHKFMRWMVPPALLVALISNILLIGQHPVYVVLLAGQMAFYGLAIVARFVPAVANNGIARIVYYFVTVNIGVGHAVLNFLSGKRYVTWQPSERLK